MTQEDEQLLFKDLCARLPYGVICTVWFENSEGWNNEDMKLSELFSDSSQQFFTSTNGSTYSDEFIPYLRPMSSMTEEEKREFHHIASLQRNYVGDGVFYTHWQINDWLNKNMFDYRGLMPMGLALEAPEGMYKND